MRKHYALWMASSARSVDERTAIAWLLRVDLLIDDRVGHGLAQIEELLP
jgi:hypothetical protein